MAKNRTHTKDFSNRALEMIMREVLCGMEECLLEASYKNAKEAGFEIIEIQSARKPGGLSVEKRDDLDAAVLRFPLKNQACG